MRSTGFAFFTITASLFAAVVYPLVAAPAPFAKTKWDAIDGDNFRLRIKTESAFVSLDGEADEYLVSLTLSNQSDRKREVPPLHSFANRIEKCGGINYIIRFPNGLVIDWSSSVDRPFRMPNEPPTTAKPIPFSLPALGSASGMYYLGDVRYSTSHFRRQFEKHRGRFCLTAVIGERGVQSNTIRYNNCPPPPRDYRPLSFIGWQPAPIEIRRTRDKNGLLQWVDDD